MIEIFAKEFNFTHASHKNMDGDWGMLPKAGPYNMSGEWGGVMGDVINGYAQSIQACNLKVPCVGTVSCFSWPAEKTATGVVKQK